MAPRITPLIISGRDVVLPSQESVFYTNPDIHESGTASLLVQGATKELCIEAVESCAKAFNTWRTTCLGERRRLFLNLADVLRRKAAELNAIVCEELQCSAVWAGINVDDTIALSEHVASLSTSAVLSGTVPEIRAPGSQAVVTPAPLGVILGIAPWNAPAILGLRAVAAAIMAGNTAILKGSELSPRTHYLIASAFGEAGFPPGVVNFLLHRPEDAADVFETIISQPDVRKCNFTGSTAVGRHIAMRAAFYLKPVLLELGGKNHVIVLDGADLEDAANKILIGALLNSGQICMSTDLVLVSRSSKDKLCLLLREKLEDFSAQHVTKLISGAGDRKIHALITDATDKGARVYTAAPKTDSGKLNGPGPDRRQHATLLENVTPDMDFWSHEAFGPLIGVAACDGLDDAIDTVNACPYGLSAAIFSGPELKVISAARRLNVGAVHINGATVHDEATLPHGGCKDSGWGRFGGHWALLEFVQTQTVIVN
ncbi:Aldehyde/histidinol dehydrogenase [Plectosphaerella plurivora]|uniref:Aldehyde/histidinol dehydrogenase n=1 Tax=Plectosphaerella plurivora TaxID=936078 RepID=A0A9P8VJC4_9PEZI|nr:Aldehyde/histidinol dehydrogenase [Plectosphaerella plurivora]